MSRREYPLQRRLPLVDEKLESGALLDRFLEYVQEKGVVLYPAQEEAILGCSTAVTSF